MFAFVGKNDLPIKSGNDPLDHLTTLTGTTLGQNTHSVFLIEWTFLTGLYMR